MNDISLHTVMKLTREHTYTHAHIHTHARTYAHTHTRTYTRTHAWLRATIKLPYWNSFLRIMILIYLLIPY